MSDVGIGVLLKGALHQRVLLPCQFSVCLFWVVRNVECNGTHFRRVLSCMEVRRGQRMLCQMIGTTAAC